MQQLLEIIKHSLEQNEPLVAATVIFRKGSAPRMPGSRMLIFRDGRTVGSIGGGPMENKVVQSAHALFTEPRTRIESFLLTPEAANGLDALCGGQMRVLVELIPPEHDVAALYSRLLTAVRSGEKVVVAMDLDALQEGVSCLPRCLIFEHGPCYGDLFLTDRVIDRLRRRLQKNSAPGIWERDGRHLFIESCGDAGSVYLFGAGHVSRATAGLAKNVAFRVIVLDERKSFANRDRFRNADKIIVLEDFEQALDGLDIQRNSYLVIVTHGHRHDRTVLAQALRTPARYIGMIGSRKKRDAIYRSLLNDGYTPKDLQRVHCPIGLSIGGETPQEIAVSIVAQLIAERYGG